MLRFRALNQESSDESEGEEDAPTVTREAQEQEAFHHYKSALLLLQNKKIDEAKKILKDILDGGVFPEGDIEENSGHPLALLKYSCLKNLAYVLSQQNDYNGALSYYIQATRIDSNDVMLWYHIGSVALKLHNYELSRDAYLEALNHSPKNWECINDLIMILYVMRDYLLCLVFISQALELDPTFVRGLVIQSAIRKECPDIFKSSQLEGICLDQNEVEYDKDISDKILKEAQRLREAKQKRKNQELRLTHIPLEEPVVNRSWVSLGKSLLVQYKRQQVVQFHRWATEIIRNARTIITRNNM